MIGQLSLFEEPEKKLEVILPKIGDWIHLNPISDNKDGGTVYTSGSLGLVTHVSETEILAKVPRTHKYHGVFTASINPKHWMFRYPPCPEKIKEEIIGFGPLAKHYQLGETNVMTFKEFKKAN